MREEAASPTARGAGDLLRLLRGSEGLTRNELIQRNGLSRSTLGARLDSLSAAGLVQTCGVGASTGGRPAARLSFDPRAYVVLAADFGATHVTVALTDLAGEVIAETSRELHIADGPEPALDWLVTAARQPWPRPEPPPKTRRHRDRAAGPGRAHHRVPIKPPIMPGWDGFSVATWVEERLGAPVYVDNDVDLMALGEHATAYPEVDHFVFVKVATGIGAGLISGRRLHRGAVGSAGDLGHVRAPHAPDVRCECGNTGCLEAVASGRAIAASFSPTGPARRSAPVRSSSCSSATTRRRPPPCAGPAATSARCSPASSTCSTRPSSSWAAACECPQPDGRHTRGRVRPEPAAGHQPPRPGASRAGARAAITGAAVTVIEEFLSPDNVDARLAALDVTACGRLVGGAAGHAVGGQPEQQVADLGGLDSGRA